VRDRAEQAASVLPPLLVAAERVAVTVAQGVHGRRRVGQGETFWQFRQYEQGDAAARIDWRESAKSQRLYVRETEWEAAQSVWLWRDASASMDYSSADHLSGAEWPTKRDRAELLLIALASLLVRGGERLTLLGSGIAPMNGRIALSRVVELISRDLSESDSLPAFEPLPRAGQLVLIGDFLSPLDAVNAAITHFAAAGLKGHMLQITDPAEEDLPASKAFATTTPPASGAIARASPQSPGRSAGASAFIAPIARRISPYWRSLPRCRLIADGERCWRSAPSPLLRRGCSSPWRRCRSSGGCCG
jgi:uncharacterized protein (DUF58 family)